MFQSKPRLSVSRDSMTRRASSPDLYTHAPTAPSGVTTIPPIDPNKPIIYLLSRDQIYHTGEMFQKTMEHFDKVGVTVKLARTHYFSRFSIQIELDEIPTESETYEFETTDTVREHIRKIDENWLDLNISHNPLCQKMIREGKLILTEWENDWLKKDKTKFLENLHHVRELYSQGTLVTEAIDMAVNAYFNTAMDRLKANAIVQGIRKRKGDEFIKSLYRKAIFEEVTILVSCEDNIAYPVTFYGNKSTSFFVFQAVKFIQQHSPAGNTQMELVDIIIPHKRKEKTAEAQPPTTRKKSTGSSELTEKEIRRFQFELAELKNQSKKQEKFFQGQISHLTAENIEKFRSLTHLEGEREFQNEVLEQKDHEVKELRTEVDELSKETELFRNIAVTQAKDLRSQAKELAEREKIILAQAKELEEKKGIIRVQTEMIERQAAMIQKLQAEAAQHSRLSGNPSNWRQLDALLQQSRTPSPSPKIFSVWRRNHTAPELSRAPDPDFAFKF